jgi:hypothetical protein
MTERTPQLAAVPVAGRRAINDWVWMLHDGEQIIDISESQFWTSDHALREGHRYVRNRIACYRALAEIKATAETAQQVEPEPVEAPQPKGKRKRA